jgi:PilZ domain
MSFNNLQRDSRRAGLLKVIIRSKHIADLEAVLRNVSETGLALRVSCPFYAGEVIEVDLPGIGFVAGTVRWVDHPRIGVELDASIDPDDLLFKLRKQDDITNAERENAPLHAASLFVHVGGIKRPGFRVP